MIHFLTFIIVHFVKICFPHHNLWEKKSVVVQWKPTCNNLTTVLKCDRKDFCNLGQLLAKFGLNFCEGDRQ